MISKHGTFDDIRRRIREEVREVTVEASRVAIKSVAMDSPVWSGAYVNSHRVQVDGKPVAPPDESNIKLNIDGDAYPPKLPESTAIKLRRGAVTRERAKLAKVKPFSRVRVLNRAVHAVNVEYGDTGGEDIGAHNNARRKPMKARYVYTRAREAARSTAGMIAKRRRRYGIPDRSRSD